MSVQRVRTKIVDKLNDLQSLKATFSYEASNALGQYPFATVTMAGGDSRFESSASNGRTRNFKVHLYQERSRAGQGSQAAEDLIAAVIDELETAFDMDTTLSGTVKYVMPVTWRASYQDRETDCRLLEINIEAFEITSSA